MAAISSTSSVSIAYQPLLNHAPKSILSACFSTFTPLLPNFRPWKRFTALWSRNQIEIDRVLKKVNEEALEENFSQFIEALESPLFHAMRAQLREFFGQLTHAKKDACLKAVATFSLKNNEEHLTRRCLNLLSSEQMLDLAKKVYKCESSFRDLVATECRRAEIEVKHTLASPSKTLVQSELRKAINYLRNLTFTVLNSLLASTQFFEIGHEPETAWDASYQLEIYYKVLSIPLAIVTFAYSYLKNPVATTLASLLALSGLASSLYGYLKWIQPVPSRLPHNGINLTQEEKISPKGATIAREAEIKAIIDQLTGNAAGGARQHCLVYGRTGVGKTELIKGLVHRIVQGDVPDVLKGKEVFSFNAATLCEVSNPYRGQSKFEDVIKKLGRHAAQAIIVLEEADGLVLSEKDANKALTILDTSANSLPFVIALVSEDKIGKIREYPALYRRFKEIKVEQTTDDQTVQILNATLKLTLPDAEVEDGLLKKIVERTNASEISSQPSKAKNALLQLCGQLQTTLEGSSIKEELAKLHGDLSREESKHLELPSDVSKESQEGLLISSKAIESIRQKIEQKEQEIVTFRNAFAEFKRMKQQERSIHKDLRLQAKRLQTQSNEPADALWFLFAKLYLMPAIVQNLKAFKEAHKLNVTLDAEALDKIVSKPKEKASENN